MKRLIMIITSLIPAGLLVSQELPVGYFSPRDSAWVHTMDSIFVEGNRAPQLQQAARISIPQEEIEAYAYRDLNEVVSGEVPGVFGTEKGVMGYGVSAGSAGKLSIRGQGGDPTTGILIAQNGKPEIMGLMGHPVPDTYSAAVVGEVEVIKGAGSIIYGSNAMGGVVNMETKKIAKDGFDTRLRLSGGSYDINRLMLQQGGKLNAWDYFLTYAHRSTRGHREHSAFESEAYHLRLGYEVSHDIYISVVGKEVPFYSEDPGKQGSETGNKYNIRRGDLALATGINLDWVQFDYQIFTNWGEHKISDGFHSTDFCDGLQLHNHLSIFPGNLTTLGFDYRDYGGELLSYSDSARLGDYGVSETAVYLFSEQELTVVRINGGVRGEWHSEYGNIIVPQFGVDFRISKGLTIYTSAGKGFRSPTIREMYLFPGPNKDLRPEESFTIESGVQYAPHRTFSTSVAVYRSTGKNKIEITGNWPVMKYINGGVYKYSGLELSSKVIPVRGLQLGINASWFISDKPVASQPANHYRITLSHHQRYFTVRANWEAVQGIQYSENGNYYTMPSYAVVNLGLDILPWKLVSLTLHVDNLLNSEYETMPGYPMPGRTLEAGLSIGI